jgi:guanylate kinase
VGKQAKQQGTLFVITAPSGAGKTSLIKALLEDEPGLKRSTSYTTRRPRPGEQDGREYHFVDEPAFLAMQGRGEFLESAQVHGNRYGTSKQTIRDVLEKGQDLILEIDWQGARQVRALYPGCVGIFILPPSMAELERRLRGRGQDAESVIQRRLANAQAEIGHAEEFKYAIINKDFNTARQELARIVRRERRAN